MGRGALWEDGSSTLGKMAEAAGRQGREEAGVWREEWRREGGIRRKQGEKGFQSPTERPHAAFRLCRRAQATPGRLGSGRDRRLWISPKPALNEILGARLGRFSATGAKNSPGGGLLGARLEML